MNDKKHGGKRPGSGPRPDGFIHRAEKLRFESEEQRQRYLKLSTSERVELALWASDVMAGKAT